MKVIDLLNKIANGEKIKKIKYKNHIYEYYNGDFKEDVGEYNTNWLFASEIIDLKNLNDEIEIIEENKESNKIKKLWHCHKEIDEDNETLQFCVKNINILVDKVNEIIDKLED